MPPKRLSLRNRYYNLEFVPRLPDNLDGECDPPETMRKRIRIALNQSLKDQQETLIHEMLHACVPDLTEDAVRETARDINNVLWSMKCRIM